MNVISTLNEASGTYEGNGVNHDNEEFKGKLTLSPILGGKGVEIQYEARGNDGTCFHQEKTIIATDFSGETKMWSLNSNSPGMTELLQRSTDDGIVFGLGDIQNRQTFREEIKIEIGKKSIGYHYSWGMPGGEFAYRSGLKMSLV